MGLRERIETEIRRAVARAQAAGGTNINVARRVNRVVVVNEGGGAAEAHAEQVAPIVQTPTTDGDSGSEHHETG